MTVSELNKYASELDTEGMASESSFVWTDGTKKMAGCNNNFYGKYGYALPDT